MSELNHTKSDCTATAICLGGYSGLFCGNCSAGLDRDADNAAERLEVLRKVLQAETISQAELLELRSLAKYIQDGDVELLEAAGVPEHTIEVELPFVGFYESVHDSIIDRAFDTQDISDEDALEYHGVDAATWADSVWSADIKWSDIHKEYAERFVEGFADEIFEGWMQFTELNSPREYNFSTDRIFAKADAERMDTIRTEVEAYPEWPEYIRERFTDRDGFWSNYPSDSKAEAWTRPALDACQWRVILQAWMQHEHEADPLNVREPIEREYNIAEDMEVSNFSSVDAALATVEQYIEAKKAEA